MGLSGKVYSNWDEVESSARHNQCLQLIQEIKTGIPLKDFNFLINQIRSLESPIEILQLQYIQQLQEEWGGSFHGMLPNLIEDIELPVPVDFLSELALIQILHTTRIKNLEAIQSVMPAYPLTFLNIPLLADGCLPLPPEWALELDLNGIDRLLETLQNGPLSREKALETAEYSAFQEMIKHRNNLGYISEPLINQETLTNFILHAASRKPLDQIWMWLSPHNYFDLADICLNINRYKNLIEKISTNKKSIETCILQSFVPFIPEGFIFQDRISFAVGWGIAGWATANTGGINIEHFKDDFSKLMITLTHETFHRLQTKIYPRSPESDPLMMDFDALVSFPFESKADQKFYEILTYIFLEGTAAYVAPSHVPDNLEKSILDGSDLLNRIFSLIYEKNNFELSENLLNEGLRSNGPFYWLGANAARLLKEAYGSKFIGTCLENGSLFFFDRAFENNIFPELPSREEFHQKVRHLFEIQKSKQE
ncbi:MAG: hypothetical protein JEZ06_22960 [Anaerolineaceae bacterium]|nr:hypothetical protein [Anaerolineaceae bacterium]